MASWNGLMRSGVKLHATNLKKLVLGNTLFVWIFHVWNKVYLYINTLEIFF